MLKRSAKNDTPSNLMLFAEDSLVRIYRWPDAARDWLASGQGYGSRLYELLQIISLESSSSKTSLAFYPATEDETLPPSFEGWSSAGMASPGGCLTLNISEWPNDAAVCSLSQVLDQDVPQKYFLSARAAAGILRGAEKRGKELPPSLLLALRQVTAAAIMADSGQSRGSIWWRFSPAI